MEDPGVDCMTILKWMFERFDGGHGLDRSGSRQGQVVGSCGWGKELSGSIKCRKFSDYLRTCQLLRKASAP